MASASVDAGLVIGRAQRDPVWFFSHVLGVEHLTPQQVALIESVRDNRRTAAPAGHSVGKTWCAARLALWFLCAHKGSKVLTTAPTWFQVKNLLWRELRQAHRDAKFPLGGSATATSLEIAEDWFAVGLSTNDPTRFQGTHAHRVLVIFDEATGVDESIWEAAEGVAVGPLDRFLAIGNPTDPTSRFKAACDSGLWNVLRLSAEDHPNVLEGRVVIPGAVTREWVDERREEYGGEETNLYRARVAGKWPEQGDDMLISLAWVERAQANWNPQGMPECAGVDIARYGSDETMIYAIHPGGHLVMSHAARGQDLMTTTGGVKALWDAGVRRIALDDGGVGGGVTDRLREQGLPVWRTSDDYPAAEESVLAIENGASAADDTKFANRRAELWWTLREHLRLGDLSLDPKDRRLAADLTNVKYGFDSRGRIKLESKDDVRKRLGRSPDRGDAVTLAVWAWKPREATADWWAVTG